MTFRLGKSAIRSVFAQYAIVGTIAALPLIWLVWRYWYYYPIWDGAIYYEAVARASLTTINPLAYNVAGHPTMGYLWLPGLLMHWLGPSYCIVLAYNAILTWYFATAVADMSTRILRGEHRLFDR
ncbi:MAG TPA: hypothetical protein VIV60_15665, partial [Polyangiaceae bacterium]